MYLYMFYLLSSQVVIIHQALYKLLELLQFTNSLIFNRCVTYEIQVCCVKNVMYLMYVCTRARMGVNYSFWFCTIQYV